MIPTGQQGSGGGITNLGDINITNSTISNNSAVRGGGIHNIDFGNVSITNSTIANNTASQSGGGVSSLQGDGSVNIRNTIIADNTASFNPDFSGPVNSQGYNLIENTTGTTITGDTTGNITGQDPILAPLGNYGGTTPTRALLRGSPAIDSGNSSGFNTDQRGLVRPVDLSVANISDGSDIGAYEASNEQELTLEADVAPRFDGNNSVSITDVQQVLRFSTGADTNYQSNEYQRADSAPYSTKGGGGSVSITDVQQALLYSTGGSLPQLAGGPATASPPSSNSKSSITSEVKASELGTPRTVRVVGGSSSAGNTVAVQIIVDGATGDERGFGFSLNYNNQVLTYNSAALGTDAPGGLPLVTPRTDPNNANNGQLGIGLIFFSNLTAGNNKQILTLQFTIAGGVGAQNVPITFGDEPAPRDVTDVNANSLPANYVNGAVMVLGPTAAAVEVGGRVLSQDGRGMSRAVINMTDVEGITRQARTNSFGYFRFTEVAVGESYVFNVSSKQYRFEPQTVTVIEAITDLIFVAADDSDKSKDKEKKTGEDTIDENGLEADIAARPKGNGTVDADDLIQVRRFLVGLDAEAAEEFRRADVAPLETGGDGILQADDVVQTRRYQIGFDSLQKGFGPLKADSKDILAEYDLTSLFEDRSKIDELFSQREVQVISEKAKAGETVEVTIAVDTLGDEGSYAFSLNYDEKLLSNPQVRIGEAGGDVLADGTGRNDGNLRGLRWLGD